MIYCEYQNLINTNEGLLFIVFKSQKCIPCKNIESLLSQWINKVHDKITIHIVDIEIHNKMYSHFINKRLLQGVPAILVYTSDNKSYMFNDSVNSSSLKEINNFFLKWSSINKNTN